MTTLTTIRGAEGDVWQLAADEGGLALQHDHGASMGHSVAMPVTSRLLRQMAADAERWEQDERRRTASASIVAFPARIGFGRMGARS
jgi:hypothetical protein